MANIPAQPFLCRFRRQLLGLGGVKEPEQLEAALRKAMAFEGPALVEVIADPKSI